MVSRKVRRNVLLIVGILIVILLIVIFSIIYNSPYSIFFNKDNRVTRVDTTDDYKGDLFIYVQNAVGGWIPSDDEIEDYTPGKWDE